MKKIIGLSLTSLMLFALIITSISSAQCVDLDSGMLVSSQEDKLLRSETKELPETGITATNVSEPESSSQEDKLLRSETEELPEAGTTASNVSELESSQEKSEKTAETSGIKYALQPTTRKEVQVWIDLYNRVLAESGLSVANNTKPHWQFEVAAEIMPEGYYCNLVDNDKSSDTKYYTFFVSPRVKADRTFTGTTGDSLQTFINSATVISGDTVVISNNVSFGNTAIKISKNITIRSSNSNNPVTLTQKNANIRHFEVDSGISLTLNNIILDGSGVGGGIQVKTNTPKTIGGKLLINTGTIVRSCVNSKPTVGQNYGGGVHLEQYSSFTMDGGTIESCRSGGGSGGEYNGGGVYINSGATFTLKSGLISKNSGYNGGGIFVDKSGTFSMTGGTINNNTATYAGGGINNNGGIFTMDGGEIGSSGNPNKAEYGGGIHMGSGTFTMNVGSVNYNVVTTGNGGGINMAGGTFTMKGGIIRENNVESGIHGGGGICISSGTFEMYKGQIYENTSAVGGGVLITNSTQAKFIMYDGLIHDNVQNYVGTYGGGGVYVERGDFTMKGGKIYDNSAVSTGGGVRITTSGTFTMDGSTAIITGNKTKVDGGGVFINNGGTFILKNGLVDKNTAEGSGGGVYVNTSTNVNLFSMEGGTLTGNSANKDGGGVYMNGGTFTMSAGLISGNEAIAGNGGGVYLPTGVATVTIGMAATTCNITNNKANSGHGGGIYAATFANNYAGLTVGQKALFTGNTASVNYEPPVDEGTSFWTNINNSSSSLDVTAHPSNHLNPVNNDDINVLTYTVRYFLNDVLEKEWTVTVTANSKIVEPSDFGGWHIGTINGVKWNFNSDRVTSDTDLYAEVQTFFNFYKVDAGDPTKTLQGAKFNLYKWVGLGAAPNELVPLDLQGSGWELISTYKSGEDGYVDIGGMNSNIVYQLAEIKAPAGYQLPMGQWRMTVSEDGKITFDTSMVDAKPLAFENTATEGSPPRYRLRNKLQYQLPLSGGQGTIWFTVMGGMIVTGCMVWISFRVKSRYKQ